MACFLWRLPWQTGGDSTDRQTDSNSVDSACASSGKESVEGRSGPRFLGSLTDAQELGLLESIYRRLRLQELSGQASLNGQQPWRATATRLEAQCRDFSRSANSHSPSASVHHGRKLCAFPHKPMAYGPNSPLSLAMIPGTVEFVAVGECCTVVVQIPARGLKAKAI